MYRMYWMETTAESGLSITEIEVKSLNYIISVERKQKRHVQEILERL